MCGTVQYSTFRTLTVKSTGVRTFLDGGVSQEKFVLRLLGSSGVSGRTLVVVFQTLVVVFHMLGAMRQ